MHRNAQFGCELQRGRRSARRDLHRHPIHVRCRLPSLFDDPRDGENADAQQCLAVALAMCSGCPCSGNAPWRFANGGLPAGGGNGVQADRVLARYSM